MTDRDALIREARALAEKADLTSEDVERIDVISAEVAKADAAAAARRDAEKRLSALLATDAPRVTKAADEAVERHARNVGEAFVSSSAFKSFRAAHPAGFSSQHDNVDVYVRDLTSLVAKASTFNRDTAVTGGGPFHLGSAVDDEIRAQQGPLLRAVTQSAADSAVLPYRALVALTPGPSIAKEAKTDDGKTPDAGLKPLGTVTTRAETATTSVVAEGLPITNQELADDSVMVSLVTDVLHALVLQKIESEIVSGDGANDRPRGIVGAAGVRSQAFATDVPTTLRKARTALGDTAGLASVVLNPEDAEALDLLADKNGRFLSSGIFGNGDTHVWRMPVIESTAVPKGTALVGDLGGYEVRWREQFSARLFNQHADYALRNLNLLLGEARFLGVFRRRKDMVVATLA